METIAPLWLWATFFVIVLAFLFVDFVVLKKQGAHEIAPKEAGHGIQKGRDLQHHDDLPTGQGVTQSLGDGAANQERFRHMHAACGEPLSIG